MPDERPAFEARLLDGSWLRVFASGRVEGVQHDIVINRIPAMINQALAQEMMTETINAEQNQAAHGAVHADATLDAT
jgi:hypothetical protein